MTSLLTQEPAQPLYIFNPKITRDILLDSLNEYLSKLESLTHLALCDDFPDYPKPIIYHYLWTLSDVVKSVREIIDALVIK